MNFMDLFATIGMKIRGYFWKLGYLAGRAFGTSGKTVFDDAFVKGFSSIGLDNIDMVQMMTDFEDAWKTQMNSWILDDETNHIDYVDMILGTMGPLMFSVDVEEAAAAMSAFTGPGWTHSIVMGTNDGTTFTPGTGAGSVVHHEVVWTGDDGAGGTTSVTKRIGEWVDPVTGGTVVVILD